MDVEAEQRVLPPKPEEQTRGAAVARVLERFGRNVHEPRG